MPEDRFGCSTQNQQGRISPAEQEGSGSGCPALRPEGVWAVSECPVGTCPAPGSYSPVTWGCAGGRVSARLPVGSTASLCKTPVTLSSSVWPPPPGIQHAGTQQEGLALGFLCQNATRVPFQTAVTLPAGAAGSEVGWHPCVLRGRAFCASSCSEPTSFPAGRGAACLAHSSPRWENVFLQRRRSA